VGGRCKLDKVRARGCRVLTWCHGEPAGVKIEVGEAPGKKLDGPRAHRGAPAAPRPIVATCARSASKGLRPLGSPSAQDARSARRLQEIGVARLLRIGSARLRLEALPGDGDLVEAIVRQLKSASSRGPRGDRPQQHPADRPRRDR